MKAVMQLIAASLVEASATGQYEGVRAALRRESIFVKIVLAPGLSYIHTLAQRRDPKDVNRASDLQPTQARAQHLALHQAVVRDIDRYRVE